MASIKKGDVYLTRNGSSVTITRVWDNGGSYPIFGKISGEGYHLSDWLHFWTREGRFYSDARESPYDLVIHSNWSVKIDAYHPDENGEEVVYGESGFDPTNAELVYEVSIVHKNYSLGLRSWGNINPNKISIDNGEGNLTQAIELANVICDHLNNKEFSDECM